MWASLEPGGTEETAELQNQLKAHGAEAESSQPSLTPSTPCPGFHTDIFSAVT